MDTAINEDPCSANIITCTTGREGRNTLEVIRLAPSASGHGTDDIVVEDLVVDKSF